MPLVGCGATDGAPGARAGGPRRGGRGRSGGRGLEVVASGMRQLSQTYATYLYRTSVATRSKTGQQFAKMQARVRRHSFLTHGDKFSGFCANPRIHRVT